MDFSYVLLAAPVCFVGEWDSELCDTVLPSSSTSLYVRQWVHAPSLTCVHVCVSRHNKLTMLGDELDAFVNLQHFRAAYNLVTDVRLSLSALTYLDLSHNAVRTHTTNDE